MTVSWAQPLIFWCAAVWAAVMPTTTGRPTSLPYFPFRPAAPRYTGRQTGVGRQPRQPRQPANLQSGEAGGWLAGWLAGLQVGWLCAAPAAVIHGSV